MEKTIIVTTDFSDSAINALNYACELTMGHNFKILLTYIYSIPASYAAEGLSLVTINDTLGSEQQMLKEELERVLGNYTHIHIETRMIIGDFIESLQELKGDQEVEDAYAVENWRLSKEFGWKNFFLQLSFVFFIGGLVTR